jgi:hypothetical protein
MQRRMDRRFFLTRTVAAAGGLAVALAGRSRQVLALGRGRRAPQPAGAAELEWFALDPEWGAGLPGCPVDPSGAHSSGGGCHACNACHLHGINKRFPSAAAANAGRAHLGCKCKVYVPSSLPRDTWIELFGDPNAPTRLTIDRRWDWVMEVLDDACDPSEISHTAFANTWKRTDKPVIDGAIQRTWMWGPQPFTCGVQEDYQESPGGKRLVQYFDKSRMEITDPTADQNTIWYVTNGLLVVELITGRMQLGHNLFEEREPAEVNVAGDSDDPTGPTYASWAGLLDGTVGFQEQTIIREISRDGNVAPNNDYAQYGIGAAIFDNVTQHWIAEPFWSFMNSSGPVYQGDTLTNDTLFPDAYYATGRPLAEACWASVKVNNTYRDVLIQCFERRVMTYTPGNPPGFDTEAGNVGQHYYQWRYA